MLNVPVNTLIFDLDNTLIDRNLAMRNAFADWLQTQGWGEHQSEAALNKIMKQDDWGYASRTAFCDWLLLTYGNAHSRNISSQQLLAILLKNIIPHIRPDSLINETLQTASRYFRLVLATNGGSITQRAKLKQAQLLSFFQPEDIFISQEVGFDKPDIRFYKKIIENLQLVPGGAIVIGDNPVNDIEAAAASDLLNMLGFAWPEADEGDPAQLRHHQYNSNQSMEAILNMSEVVKRMHILFVTLDSLRYDVAAALFSQGNTPNLRQYCTDGWQRCHSPGSFTYAAHHAFFAGFLPTPATAPKAPRLFATRFAGSETTSANTQVFDTPDIISGFAGLGFRTICIGGVGFFNKQTALGQVLPSLFNESFWDPSFGVTDSDSTRHQFEHAAQIVTNAQQEQLFLFINVSAIHQPNYFYLPGSQSDTIESHAAALRYVDSQLPVLLDALRKKDRDTFCILCSDHGTAYGEDDYYGHRIGHATVWEVPMATFVLKKDY